MHYCYLWLSITIFLHTQFLLHLYLKTILSLHISHKYRFDSNKHTKIHKKTSIFEEKQKRRRRTRKTGRIDIELLMFEENCIILRKSYLLLLLLLMLIFLFYPISKIFFVIAYFSRRRQGISILISILSYFGLRNIDKRRRRTQKKRRIDTE